MKKKLTGILLLLLFIALPLQGQAKVKAPKKQCHAYVVMDAGSGEVLFGQDANKKIYPASTAKLMTAIVCVEKGNVNSVIKTKSDVVYRTTPGTYLSLIHIYKVAVPKVFIPVFPGTNCEYDSAKAFRRAGAERCV